MSCFIDSVKEATRLISRNGNRTRMIVAGILLMFSLVLPMMTALYALYVVYVNIEIDPRVLYAVLYGITLFMGIFISLPTVAMFVTYSQKVYSETKFGYADVKRRGAYNYFRSFFSTVVLFIGPIILFVMIQLAYELTGDIRGYLVRQFNLAIPTLAILIPMWCVILVIFAFIAWLANSAFLAPYYYSRGMSAFKAIKESRRTTKRHPFYSDLFSIFFIVLSAISLLTFGVLFVLWVLPLMMFTYFELADRMDSERITEDKNE